MKCMCGKRFFVKDTHVETLGDVTHCVNKPCYTNSSTPPVPAPTKALKHDNDKLDLSLIPYAALKAETIAFMVGQKKYGRYNYCKGHNASQLVAAAQRHLMAWFEGEETDLIDGQPHLGSVRACCAMILRQQELGTLMDDRYKEDAIDANNK